MAKENKDNEKPTAENIRPVRITDELQESYIDYAMSVIVSRAIPDIRDGLKPVQRRILWAMWDMNLKSGAKFVKSARIVGDCFVKDTLISTEKGLVPIQSIKVDDRVHTQFGLRKVTQLYGMPPKNLLKVTLENGIENIVTPSQEFKILKPNLTFEWKKAKDLTLDDYLVLKSARTKVKHNPVLQSINKTFPSSMSPSLAYVLGAFISDGWISKDYGYNPTWRLGFSSGDEEVMKEVQKIFKKEFNYNPKIEIRKYTLQSDPNTVRNIYSLRINRKEINEFFVDNFGVDGKNAYTKFIPDIILQSSDRVVSALLSGLLDGDGSVHINRNQICYSSVSNKLIQQLSALLFSYNIIARIYEIDVKNRKPSEVNGKKIEGTVNSYNLEVTGTDAISLAKMVSLSSPKKRKRAERMIEQFNNIENNKGRHDKFRVIPYAGKVLFQEFSDKHLGGGWYEDSDSNKFRQGIKYPSGIKIRYSFDLRDKNVNKTQIVDLGIRKKLKRMDSTFFEFADNLIKNDLSFIKTSSVKSAGMTETYDIQVEEKHEFIANGVVSHNCLGKYHPHGDSAVYDALVRMAQDFSLRYPLIHGQGNFGCFTGDTKIKLTDGRSLSFKELIKEDKESRKNYTFTFDNEAGEIEIAEIKNPRKTKKATKLVKIVLDNGEEIRCTPDHRFMLRDGKYREAQNLNPGDSLMPSYIRFSSKDDNPEVIGYPMIQQPRLSEWSFIHHLADKWNLENNRYKKSAGRVRHHKDFNKKNNNPDNVVRMGWKEHWNFHAKMAAWRHKNDPEYVQKLARGRQEYIKNNREIFSERAKGLNKKLWKSEEFRKKISNQLKEMWQNPEYRERMSKLASRRLKKKWQEEEFQKLMSGIKSAEMKKRWQNPEYRRKQTEQMKKMSNELWSNEEHRKYMSKLMKKKAENPEWRVERSRISKELWQKPEYRNKYPKNHFSEMAKKLWEDESVREFHKEKAKKQWLDPKFKKKVIKAVREGNKRFLGENPNHMQEMAEIAKKTLKKKWQSPAYKSRVIKSKILKHVHGLLDKYEDVTPDIYEKERISNGTPTFENALGYFGDFKKIIEESRTYNHIVKSVKLVEKKEDVYDITIDNTHNFLLDAGVFVHNSIDSDPAAAQRYTEAKLTKIAEELLIDIEKDTVDWGPNYDNTRQEPKFLPAKFPANLLLNGTMGIAVGMATSIPPHNLGEIIDATTYLVNNPEATIRNLMKFLPGPDFPTGGIIYDAGSLEKAYTTGRGSVTTRAAVDIEKRDSYMSIVINEIPYQVNKASLVEKMAKLVQDKKVEGIKDIRDESGREGLRIVIDLKQDVNPERILNQLFKHTELQKNFYFNMVALVNGIQPQVVSLKDILSEYIKHRRKVIVCRIKYDLKKAEDRAHILEGLVIALKSIDAVITTIKKSKDRADAHKNLIKKFNLSDIQSDAILDMKLQSLVALESQKLEGELKEKKKLIKEFKIILKNDKKILSIVTDELDEIKKEYADERRTRMIEGALKEFKDEDFIPKQEAVIILTSDGYIKRMLPDSFKIQGRGGQGLHSFSLKEEDKVSKLLVAQTHNSILFFTDSGKVFKTRVYEIPKSNRTAKGKLVHTFLGLSDKEKITAILAYNGKDKSVQDKYFVMATENGMVKKTKVPELDNIRSTGIVAVNLKGSDVLKWVDISTGSDDFMVVTKKGQAVRFHESEVRPMGRSAGGVKAINLKNKDKVTGFIIIENDKDEKNRKLLIITENGYGKQTLIKKYKTQRRGGRGIATAKVTKKTGLLTAARLINGKLEEVIAFSARGLVIRTELKDIRTAGRATQGVKIMRIDKDDLVVGVVCL